MANLYEGFARTSVHGGDFSLAGQTKSTVIDVYLWFVRDEDSNDCILSVCKYMYIHLYIYVLHICIHV
jgi:hypothetical protein